MLNACFSSGSLEFCYVLGRGYLHGHPLMIKKKPGTLSLSRASLVTTFRSCCHNLLLEEVSKSCVRHRARILGSVCLISSGFCSIRLFPLLILLCSLSLSYILALSTTICRVLCLPSESPNLGVVLGTPNTALLLTPFPSDLTELPVTLITVTRAGQRHGPSVTCTGSFPGSALPRATSLNPALAPRLAHVHCPPTSIP